MNSKERMVKALSKQQPDVIPVDLFPGTEYMCRVSGVPDYEFLYGDGKRRAEAHVATAQKHKVDAIVIWAMGRTKQWRKEHHVEVGPDEAWLVNHETGERFRLSQDYYAVYRDTPPPLTAPLHMDAEFEYLVKGQQYYGMRKLDIRTKKDVDKLLPLEKVDSVLERGSRDTIKAVVDLCAEGEFFIEVGAAGSIFRFAVGLLGFEEGMIFMHEQPAVFHYLMQRMTEQHIEYAKAARAYGADGLHAGEVWTGSDLLSAKDYDEFCLPYNKMFVQEAHNMGLTVKWYFTGNVMPRLHQLVELQADALMVEESFGIDIGRVRDVVGDRLCLLGNVDAINLLTTGTPEQIAAEVKRQIEVGAKKGPFIMGTGSEIVVSTPPENVNALVEATREFGRYPLKF